MHLMDILKLRHIPAAGISIGLTRRCPLHCAHCSTNSTMESDEYPASLFERFVGTFTNDNRPEILSLSGGEALLRPRLVCALAGRAREAGTRTSVLSGLFFARDGRIAPAIRAVFDAVDHFSVSVDIYHEREVPRAQVFSVLEAVLDRGTDVSMHLVGTDSEDPYLKGLIEDVRARFHDRVPMVVNAISYFGRARNWLAKPDKASAGRHEANPCTMAAWPVVGFDGRIVACGNDAVFERLPSHLLLGHARDDDWATIRSRTEESHLLRAIRLFGPEYIASRSNTSRVACDGYCETCMTLSRASTIEQQFEEVMVRPSTRVLESAVRSLLDDGGAPSFLRQHGILRYAELATLGAPV